MLIVFCCNTYIQMEPGDLINYRERLLSHQKFNGNKAISYFKENLKKSILILPTITKDKPHIFEII